MRNKTSAVPREETRLDGISDIRDESDRSGMRVVIELKRDANPQVVLNRLFAQTQLQTTFAINMLALVNNQSQPRILTLRQMIDEYLTFQQEVLVRRTRYELRKAEERAHLLRGLLIAQDHIDEVIRIIRESYDDAKENLKNAFGLDDVQAQVILDMQLKRLQGLEREKLQNEYEELQKKIAYYNELLSDHAKLVGVLRAELLELRDRFGDDRLTEIQEVEDEIDIEDLIVRQDCAYTLTHAGYIKRMPTAAYRTQNRGGRGVNAMATREEDFVKYLFTGSTHDYILFFSNLGKVYKLKGYQIPESGRSAKGSNIVNLLEVEQGEKITAMFPIAEFTDDKYMVFVTKQGVIKRVVLSDLQNIRRSGLRALGLAEDDELVDVRLTSGDENIMIATHLGKVITFPEGEVRAMGRAAVGVRGIRLAEGDYVVGAARARENAELLSITEKGYGKRTPVGEFSVHHRGGSGITLHGLTEKTGPVAGVAVVDHDNAVMIITDDGVIIRTPCEQIRVCGRASQGVIVMRTGEDVKVISITRTVKQEDEESDADEE